MLKHGEKTIGLNKYLIVLFPKPEVFSVLQTVECILVVKKYNCYKTKQSKKPQPPPTLNLLLSEKHGSMFFYPIQSFLFSQDK